MAKVETLSNMDRARRAIPHLSDDETVAKMGHPNFRRGPPARRMTPKKTKTTTANTNADPFGDDNKKSKDNCNSAGKCNCGLNSTVRSDSGRLGRQIFAAHGDVTFSRGLLASFPIKLFVARLPCIQSINVSVVHAEGCCNQNRVVNLSICRTLRSGSSMSAAVTCLPPFCTFAAITSNVFSFSEMSAA